MMQLLQRSVNSVQSKLNFDTWDASYTQFNTKTVSCNNQKRQQRRNYSGSSSNSAYYCYHGKSSSSSSSNSILTILGKLNRFIIKNQGLGRVALIGSILGFLLGFHLLFCVQTIIHIITESVPLQSLEDKIGIDRVHLLFQWCTYFVTLCTFHILEFFITAIYNPTQVTADSYLINHSTSYTMAAISSWIEFWIRFIFFPKVNIRYISYIGCCIVIIGQYIRTGAMITASTSFNHMIQNVKKHNHILIQHGIYKYLRHPSYVGFFYWSISTQIILCNPIHIILYTLISWNFFNRRIQYEEESLKQFFPNEYIQYMKTTYMGIPFIKSNLLS